MHVLMAILAVMSLCALAGMAMGSFYGMGVKAGINVCRKVIATQLIRARRNDSAAVMLNFDRMLAGAV